MKRFLTASILVLTLAGCSSAATPASKTVQPDLASLEYETIVLEAPDGGSIMLNVEMADTPERRQQGLMHRESLDPGTGMLFAFDAEQTLNFWMKNTLIPLDIIFFDASGAFVSATSMVPCKADPCPYYASEQPSEWALEVPAGFIEKARVGEGWHIKPDGQL